MKYSSQLIAIGMSTILMTGNMGFSFASQIGTGTVVGSGTLTTPVNWNDTFSTPEASGSINGLVVTARVLPTLNMTISGSGTIDLGNLSSTSVSSGSVDIEIGTNALNGASVTARSTNGGLANVASGTHIINDLTADNYADSYKFLSSANPTDSTAPGFSQSGTANTEVNDSITNHTLYSSSRPQPVNNIDDFSFQVAAQPNAQTPAGDYRDLVIVTVTGNF